MLYVCVHNSGRSQMAEAFTNRLANNGDLPVEAISAGTIGGKEINPVVRQAMAEIGFEMEGQTPKVLTRTMVDKATRIVSMGCGVDAEACPTKFLITEDWGLDDPAGAPLAEVRRIRDQIRDRVERLLVELPAR